MTLRPLEHLLYLGICSTSCACKLCERYVVMGKLLEHHQPHVKVAFRLPLPYDKKQYNV
jgi:hypothetical protein